MRSLTNVLCLVSLPLALNQCHCCQGPSECVLALKRLSFLLIISYHRTCPSQAAASHSSPADPHPPCGPLPCPPPSWHQFVLVCGVVPVVADPLIGIRLGTTGEYCHRGLHHGLYLAILNMNIKMVQVCYSKQLQPFPLDRDRQPPSSCRISSPPRPSDVWPHARGRPRTPCCRPPSTFSTCRYFSNLIHRGKLFNFHWQIKH